MSSLFDSLSEELFQVLKGSGKTLTLYGADGNKTYEPKEARRVFATPDNIMISVVEAGSDSEVKLYLSQSTDVKAMSRLINTLRQISTRYNVLFNVRKYAKELSPKDFAYQATIGEAAMWGTTRTSYQSFGSTKLIVRHTAPVREGVIGARGRNILSMFVETADGERFRFPVNHLSGGRAYAQHINQHGKPHDEIGTQIATLARESLDLANVSRYIRHARRHLGAQAVAIRPKLRERITEIRKSFLGLSRPRGYAKISEAGLPRVNQALNEDQNLEQRISLLAQVLQINSNHALAESLMPVALLTMGEKMTNINEVFEGIIALDEATADALVEALQDEYGQDSSNWALVDGGIGFANESVLEDARDYLSITGLDSHLVEDVEDVEDAEKPDNPITSYAKKWTMNRYAASGETSEMDKEQVKGIGELAMGIADIVSGHVNMPDYPEVAPQFSKMDPTVKDRYFLDLYVGQHKLANVATLNYVSNIIDKIAEGKKLDSVEKHVSDKLIQMLSDDLGEGIVDEGYYDDFPHDDREDGKYESALEDIEDSFDVKAFVQDIYPHVMDGDDKEDPLDTKYVMTNLDSHVAIEMDARDFRAQKGQFENIAKELFPKVREFCQHLGYGFESVVKEFAETEDQPGHHGIAAGDSVATDMGPGQVISVEGDLAHVEFLHGGVKTLHVDDLDKVETTLNGIAEEAELAEWFNGFDPKAILGELAAPKDPYDQGRIAQSSGKARRDNPHGEDNQDGQAWLRGYHGMSHPFNNDIDEDGPAPGEETMSQTYFHGNMVGDAGDFINAVAKYHGWAVENQADSIINDGEPFEEQNSNALRYIMMIAKDRGETELAQELETYLSMGESRVDELSQDKVQDYFNRGASDRGRAEKKGDMDKAARRDRGLSMAFKKMREDAELDEGVADLNLDGIFDDLKAKAQDIISDPEKYGLENPDDVYDDQDEAEEAFYRGLQNVLTGQLEDKIYNLRHGVQEDEEVLGGDQGEDLIDDTKVHPEGEMDEAAQTELDTLIKNARFRM